MKVITAAGETIELGTTETAPTIGVIDYSRRVTDNFGVTTVVERGFARRMSVRLGVPFDGVDALQRRLADLRATSALWVADERFNSLSVQGFYKDFEIDLSVPPLSFCTLTVEGLADEGQVVDAGADPAPAGYASTLQLLQPVVVADSMLTSSSIAEDDYPEWSAGISYPLGALVIKAAAHRVYESSKAANGGNDPAGASGLWIDVGPTKRWAMFDQALGTAATATGLIEVALAAGTVQAVALLDVVATAVRVRSTGYDRTIAVGAGAITFLDIPSVISPVTVTITGPGVVSVGSLLIGSLVGLGVTEASPTAGITDYSRKDVDDFGEVTIVKRAWAKRMTAKALIRTDAIDAVASRIAAVRARPSLWVGQAGLDSLTIYGFFKDFSIEAGEGVSKLSLSIEGLSLAAKVEPLGAQINWPDIADPTGTKPTDNADKTGDNTSKDTNAVGGRPAASVLDQIAGNTFNHVVAVAEAETARLRTRALSFLGPLGEDSYTLIRRETTERKDADGVFAETFEILGAVTPDGTAFVLNTSTVRINATESFAQRFDAIAATFEDNAASIEHIDQVLVGPDGASARALVKLDVNGRIIGTALTNDGSEGAFVVSADNFRIEDPDTGNPYFYADDTGKVLMHDVEVDTLKVGSVDYDAMTMGAAQKAAFYTLPGNVVVGRGTTVQVASITFVKEDADSILEVQMFANMKSVDDLQFDTTILCDDMVMQQSQVNIVLDNTSSAGQMPITPFAFITGISAGTRTIAFKVYNREDDNVNLTVQAGSTLKVVELRKASIGSSSGSGGAIPPPPTGGGGGYDGGGGTRPNQIQNQP